MTLEPAKPAEIIGRLVGHNNDHVAVAVVPDSTGKGGYLLAVRRDGGEYVTWAWGLNMAEDGLNVWWGHYFSPGFYTGAYGAFTSATADLAERAALLH